MQTQSYLATFEQHLNASAWPSGYPSLYDPCAYLMQIGGKRVRPVSLLMAYHMFQSDFAPALDAALSVEVFHNFTLMHDDIMDQAALRRNQPTVHTKYNTNTAILSGDVMLIHAYDLMLKCCDKKTYGPVLETFTTVARGVCEGQCLDMDFETTENVQLKTYIQMISLKTAVLLAGSLKIGGLLAGAKKRDAQLLYQFGLDAGIAFQILDDYLDAFANQADFGKTVGGDIIQGKKTYLVLRAFEVLKRKEKTDLRKLLASNHLPAEQKVAKVKAIFQHYGIDAQAREAAAAYTRKAEAALEKIQVAPERKQALSGLLNELLGRKV
jgi:geranylgeranyl diphosphate synthase, type II